MKMWRPWVIALAWASIPLAGGDLAMPTLAKFIRVVALGTGSSSVICEGKELAVELAGLGILLDPEARVAWSDSERDVARLAKQKKLVICGTRGLLVAGATLAVVAEGGRPVIYLNPRALTLSGLTLPDSIHKIAKVNP